MGISEEGMVAVPGAEVGANQVLAQLWCWTHGFVICSLFFILYAAIHEWTQLYS